MRNIVVCPFAGIVRNEPFDVSPFAEALGRHLLRNPLTQKLPRKFKIAFEGCEGADHVGLPLQDVGVRAVRCDDGRTGFRITLAGGLGGLPQAGIELEPFTPAADLAATVEAVVRLFDRTGDRERRGRARLKFVARAMGEAAFREAVFSERRSDGSPGSTRRIAPPDPSGRPPVSPPEGNPPGGWPGAFFQKIPGSVAVPVRVPLGDLSPEQLRALADLAEGTVAIVRFTPGQGILLADLSAAYVEKVVHSLRSKGFFPPSSVPLTRCAGTETCTVGTTGARSLAALLEEEVVSPADFGPSPDGEIRLGVSGCANGCGRHMVADVGLQGTSHSVTGRGGVADRKAPVYVLFLGGGTSGSGGVRFGSRVGRIPVRRVPEAVRRLLGVLRRNARPGEGTGETISRLGMPPILAALGELVDPPPGSFSEEDFFDLGVPDPVPFPPDRSGPRAP